MGTGNQSIGSLATSLAWIGIVAVGLGAASTASAAVWHDVESPVGVTLYDVNYTADGPHAVGGGGVVLQRTNTGWTKVIDGGPTGNGNDLYGAHVTSDNETIWFVGSSGAIGEYNVQTGVLEDHSAPNDVTNNFNDVAVTGPSGDANVYIAGDSGKIYYSFEDGDSGTWHSVTPGSGSNINSIDFYGGRKGHAVDGNKTVFHSTDGEIWQKIGIENADFNFYGVDSDASDDVSVVGGGASVYHWDGAAWMRRDLGNPALRSADINIPADEGLVAGDGGAIYRGTPDTGFTRESTPVGENLKAVVRGRIDIAVGASGTILEYR